MTIKDGKILILEHFKTVQVINEEELPKLLLNSGNIKLNVEILKAALEELETNKIAKRLVITPAIVTKTTQIPPKIAWVLTQPLSAYGQTINLSADVVFELAALINNYCRIANIDEPADPLNITEKEIVGLILLYKDAVARLGKINEASTGTTSPTNPKN